MRRSLLKLNGRHLPKALSQTLALLTILLLPSIAWGQAKIIVAGHEPDATTGNFTGDGITLADGGSVNFVSTGDNSGTLTLNNATITTGIESNLDNLTIKLVGNNEVNSAASNGTSGDNYAIYSNNNNATLTIVRDEAKANTELNLNARYAYSIIGGFASVSYGEGDYQTYLSSPYMPAGYGTLSGINQIIAYGSPGNYITNATITSAVTYPIWVSGTQITHANLGSATENHYTYIEDENTLQLSGINIESDGYAICSDVESLKVKLVGENSIHITYPFYSFYNGNATISFTTDPSNPGSLSLPRFSENSEYDVITGFTNSANPTVENGLVWQPTTSGEHIVSATISTVDYGLTVADVTVTSANAGNITGDGISVAEGGKVSFTPADGTNPATLTLNGATLTNYINWNTDADLTIELKGANSINYTDGSCFVSSHDRKISFIQGDASNPCSLALSCGREGVIGFGFSNYTTPIMGAGLYWFPTKDDKNIITSAIVKTLLSGGAGTDESPLLIKTYDDLKDFATYVNDGTLTTEFFRLDADIDCNGKTDFVPIGNDSHPFKGTFDGNEKAIKNLQYATESTTTPVGFFGTISGGTVKNLTLSNCSFSGGSSTGAIVGNFESGTLSNNFYDADVTVTNGTTTKSGQTQRGIGNSDDVIGQVELAGTKKVTVKYESIVGNIKHEAVEGTYYTSIITNVNEKIDYYVLPGCNFTYSMKPKDGYKPRFALSDNTIEVTTVEKTENGAYDHTEFTFTMPSVDLEVTWSYPIDLAAISADNFSIDDANYTGEAIVPTIVKVTGVPGSVPSATRRLEKDRDFTIKGYKLNDESADSPVDVGTYTVTIEGIDNYIGTQDVSYEIVKSYALKINGTQLNAKNIDDFYGNGTVKFTPATETEPTNTLTLNGASIYGAIESGLGNLTIKLIGSNTIQGNGSSLITSLNGGTLTFDSDGTTISLLEFKDASGNVFPNDPISGFAEVKYGWFEYVESEGFKKVCSWDIEILKNGTSYRIYDGNKDHILGEGDESVKYSHDATNGHVITLNNAEVNCIWTDIHADITIALNGTNRVIDTGGTYAIYSNNGKINFVKAEGATSVELTATSGAGGTAISTYSLGSGLYEKPMSETSTVITDDPEFIIIENYVMTDDRSIGTATSGITYNSTEKILTFNSYAGDLTSQIKTGVQGLTIKLKGTSTVAAGSLDYPFKAMTNTASILFDGENGSETGSLVMDTNSDSAPFEGFAEGAITYNKVVYSRDDGGNNIHTIKAPTAPAMSLDNEKVKLTKDYDDGTIYYSIDYADDTEDLDNATYSEPFALTHPATVTAWAEANNATTSTVTGKYFAYQDAPYSMVIGDTKTPTLLPAIAEGDALELSVYTSEDSDVATFADGLITAKNFGTAVLSVTLTAGDMTPFIVLNPVPDPNAPNEYAISFSVKVGAKLDNYFEAGNEYASYYNDADETYAVPDGMKAYVVTGVSGSKLMIEETTVMPPLTVVLLEKGTATLFTKIRAAGTAPAGNLLKHATSEVPATSESSLYVLYNDQYVKVTSGTQIPTGKNYLDLGTSANAGTRGFYNIVGGADDGSTGIREVKNGEVKSGEVKGEKWSDGEWYDLQGRRLPAKPLKPGLYLHNGHKVVIK